jgi:GAF domain-containing protein
MRRGAKPAEAKVEAELAAARKSLRNEGSKRRELEKRLAESLEREEATSAILRVISRSPTHLQPTLHAIAERAAQLCDAWNGTIVLSDGEALCMEAHYGPLTEQIGMKLPIDRGSVSGRAFVEGSPVHVADLSEAADFPLGRQIAVRFGVRTILAAPLVREVPIGVILIRRMEIRPFSDKQIELLQTFADQAVIAIENARLFNETKEALEQQTATSEILRVISRSPTDVQPVFDTIAESVVRLCNGHLSGVYRFDGSMIHFAAHYNWTGEGLESVRLVYPRAPSRETQVGTAILDRTIVEVRDFENDPTVPTPSLPLARALGYRSILVVPMLREGNPIGAIAVARASAGPFSVKQAALLQTFADQAVIAIENVRLFKELEARNADLTEALGQQTATSEILRVISASPTNVQPVFEAIVASARRLCEATFSSLNLLEDGQLMLTAADGVSPTVMAGAQQAYPQPIARGSTSGRAILERRVVHIEDARLDPDYTNPIRDSIGIRSVLTVPLLREDLPIGAVSVWRSEVRPFTETQIALLQTFADQAVIAIENARLFKELEARNTELTDALEKQTATSEILRVISASQTDVQPVFDTIIRSGVRLLGGFSGVITQIVGDQLHLAALTSTNPSGDTAQKALWPRPVKEDTSLHGQVITALAPLFITDVEADQSVPATEVAVARARGYRSIVAVPLLRDGRAVGSMTVTRRAPGPFADVQVALLRTFADQAVIAIENVRLFKELETRNRDLTESLEQQTATAEILRVISRSQTDVRPVFDTIVRSAVRLCDGLFSALFQFDGQLLHHVAQHNFTPEALEAQHRVFPARPTRALGSGRAVLERAVVHIPDMEVDPEFQHQTLSRAVGSRSGLYVPMLREGAPIGVIMVTRAEPRPFSDSEIALLKTFADQAVIAVENVRLFKALEARTGELTQSVEKLTALGEVSRAVSSTLEVETVLDTIVSRASQLAGAAGCSIYEYDEGAQQFELRATHHDDPAFVEALRASPLRKGEGLMGRAAEMREPIQIPDITQPGAYRSSVRDTLTRFGYRALLAVPLLREDQIIGSLSLTRKTPGEYAPEVIDVLKSFATQSALAIQNARLFREIADKSAQLEAASRHKSEFLANMSHELRTPLNAIIGFSEILAEKMFGDINEKQTEYLQDILESGRHLLSLINDILDLSKIEAGRMELELSEFDLPTAIENSLILVRERASRRGIRLGSTVDGRLGMISGDERKVKQVLLNLLSNALKFTPEGGQIDVGARLDGEMAEVSVADTGIGIAPEDQEAVFEEFRQVGTADKKAEGTGLGLALSRKFIELHGGTIWLKSQLGSGSTFTFMLPLTIDQRRS